VNSLNALGHTPKLTPWFKTMATSSLLTASRFAPQTVGSAQGANALPCIPGTQGPAAASRRPGTAAWVSQTVGSAPLSTRWHDESHNL